ncbi:MAG: LemA family protein [Gammaproteobacteria bacterium]
MNLFKKIPLLLLLGAIVALSGCGINNIPTYDEGAKSAWSDVMNQYKRRADLVPNLINTVKGFAAHEKDVLMSVVEARSKATSTPVPADILTNPEAFKSFQQNQNALGSALSRLMVVVERYPELKSSQNFLTLQSQLEGTENRIAVARHDFIEAVRRYNTELRTIPGRWWKSFMYPDSVAMENFSAAPELETVPEVQF